MRARKVVALPPTDVTVEESESGFFLSTVPDPRGSCGGVAATVPAVIRMRKQGAPGDHAVKVTLEDGAVRYELRNRLGKVIMDPESIAAEVVRKYPLARASARASA